MKKKFIVALSMLSLTVACPSVSYLQAQDFAEGPIAEISPISGGNLFAGADSVGPGFVDRPNVAFTPSGVAIEVFDPNVPTIGPGTTFDDAVGGAAGAGAVQITADGRIDLQGENSQSPESALWAPARPSDGGWSDGPMGVQLGVDWLFFSRSINGGGAFAFNNAGEAFSNADIDFDVESTPRYRIGVASEQGTGYEFVTYDFNEFSGNLSLTGGGITPIFFGSIPEEPADSYAATYQSRIKSFELNVWARRSENLRVGYGLRHFSIEEEYDITLGADSNTSDPNAAATDGFSGFFSSTDNNLFGGQIMLELYKKIATGTYIEGGVKGFLLNNRAEVDADTANLDRNGEDSFITGGVNFNGGINYRVFRGFSLRAGYEGVFIGSVAGGATQSENNSLFAESFSPVGESLYYGGGYVGCTVTF